MRYLAFYGVGKFVFDKRERFIRYICMDVCTGPDNQNCFFYKYDTTSKLLDLFIPETHPLFISKLIGSAVFEILHNLYDDKVGYNFTDKTGTITFELRMDMLAAFIKQHPELCDMLQ